MDLENPVALVTGAARGIGKATAQRFSDDDRFTDVVLLDKNESVRDVATRMEETGYVVDVGDFDEVKDCIEEIEKSQPILTAINNASVASNFHISELEPEEWNRIITTNLTGYYNIARCVTPLMYERELGYLVNLSSGAGLKGSLSAGVHYSASKAGIFGLTKGLAKQLSPHVRVNCVVPGLIDTFDDKKREIEDNQLWTEEGFEKYREMVPQRRLGEPDEVARVIQFLSGDGAEYMTGSIVQVDGGGDMLPVREFLMQSDG